MPLIIEDMSEDDMTEKLRIAIPIWADPTEEQPDVEELALQAQEEADSMAGERGLIASPVEHIETTLGLVDSTGHYVLNEDGVAAHPRVAVFAAECEPRNADHG